MLLNARGRAAIRIGTTERTYHPEFSGYRAVGVCNRFDGVFIIIIGTPFFYIAKHLIELCIGPIFILGQRLLPD